MYSEEFSNPMCQATVKEQNAQICTGKALI